MAGVPGRSAVSHPNGWIPIRATGSARSCHAARWLGGFLPKWTGSRVW